MYTEATVTLVYLVGLFLYCFSRQERSPKIGVVALIGFGNALTIVSPNCFGALIGWAASLTPLLWAAWKPDAGLTPCSVRKYRIFMAYQMVGFGLALTLTFLLGGPFQGWTDFGLSLLASPYVPLGLLAIFLREGLLPFHSSILGLGDNAKVATTLFLSGHTGLVLFGKLVMGGMTALPAVPLFSSILIAGFAYLAVVAIGATSFRKFINCVFIMETKLTFIAITHLASQGVEPWSLTFSSLILSSFGLLWIADLLEARVGTLPLGHGYYGLYSHMPLLGNSFLFFTLVALNLPGTLDFVVEELILNHFPQADLFWVGLILVSYAVLGIGVFHTYNRVFGGEANPNLTSCDLDGRERVSCAAYAALSFGLGLCPWIVS